MLLSVGTQRAGRAGRDRQAPAVGGDAGLDVGDLLGQDRHADAEPDDGARAVVVGRRFNVDGEGYSTTGRILRVAGTGDAPLEPFLLPMALANDAVIRDGACIGDPTEGALVVLAAKGGLDVEETRQAYPPRRPRCRSTPSTS